MQIENVLSEGKIWEDPQLISFQLTDAQTIRKEMASVEIEIK